MQFGSETYRKGALERIGEAQMLYRSDQFVGSIYLAGLAVAAYMRALVWRRDNQFDERHDLKRIAIRVRGLGIVATRSARSQFRRHRIQCSEAVAQ